jgi:flagellar basal-body rod protein FlgB
MRHMAIANNIANAGTAGYAPARVDFEQQMEAARAALSRGEAVKPDMLAGVQPTLLRGAPAPATDRSAALDSEIAELAQNTVQYQALLRALGKHLTILGSAISEGKR